jgi:DNA-binding transcriptional ArsR family regulator
VKFIENLRTALKHSFRQRLFTVLLVDELCECVLAEMLDREVLHVSLHLKFLEKHGLVDSEKRGSWTYYRARSNPAEEALNFVRNNDGQTDQSWKQLRDELSSVRSNRLCSSSATNYEEPLSEAL